MRNLLLNNIIDIIQINQYNMILLKNKWMIYLMNLLWDSKQKIKLLKSIKDWKKFKKNYK